MIALKCLKSLGLESWGERVIVLESCRVVIPSLKNSVSDRGGSQLLSTPRGCLESRAEGDREVAPTATWIASAAISHVC
jgi:hypothetical protein